MLVLSTRVVKTFRNIMIAIVCLVLVAIIVVGITYKINLSAVDKDDHEEIEVVIPPNTSTKEIGKILKEKDLIRSSTFFNIYVKLFNVSGLQSGTHTLSRDMSFEKIIEKLKEKDTVTPSEGEISITFKEGLSMRQIAEVIEKNTNNKKEDVINLSNDKEYIEELIKKYWFITEDINNDDLYYKLEGYLYPDTYRFAGKDVSVKDIFNKMLNQMDKKLSQYKEIMEEKKLSVHFVLTMASIVEKEGKTRDFKDISSTFYNRIDKNMKFESCATAIYGIKKEFSDYTGNRAITNVEMQDDNKYNTYMVQVPVGPIGNPGSDAIEAAINPNKTEYLYFLSDNQGNTYFFNTYAEHQNKQKELEKVGKW